MSEVYRALGPGGFDSYGVEWIDGQPRFTRSSELGELLLAPGLVDIHVHGGFGIDFMSSGKEEMSTLCDKFAGCGYELFLPTTVTASIGDVKQALSNIPDHPLVGGFHLEGPFISPLHPGAQPPESILDPESALDDWRTVLEDARLKVVTMAPEIPGALDLARFLSNRGVVVSMGHTDATYEQAKKGYEAGALHTTHTYNAMRGLHHREAGTVGYALLNDAIRCELIYDRKHVSKEAGEILLRSKPAGGVIGISDGTKATGAAPGTEVDMWGHACVTGDHEVRLKSNGALAGSAVTLLDVFRNMAEDFGPEAAIRACTINPRQALRLHEPPQTYLLFDHRYDIVERRDNRTAPR
ncbi:MAG TPA: amidohydrolase family protein [Fimbriimonadaceae bacterium]|nr:amidohydrolase family protein [Fimbriimonadaceae bacterium]